ncbi:phosphohistidine phosphatase SixA [Vibrio artabrorum]|uniref:Phosphohistidine phosphatase SixA n=1 Tax=Vibrio artabrorum TaxID=446374 RepID=A0ABT8CF81_9VIBR|nr:phosphohistidine phosphatase SixA [Vibrio artabrorum]MDN3699975.1 phosphohistidine phosphatase SixA [Vibrio artabrorum]
MKIFIMRHGEAEHFANSDAERALTKRGKIASLAVAQAAAEQGFNQFDKVLVSPYLRAQETWLEISQVFSGKKVEISDDITPYGISSDVFDLTLALADVEKLETILFVSHLPLVGYLTAEFVTGMAPPMFPTSGLACIEFDLEKQTGELLFNINR